MIEPKVPVSYPVYQASLENYLASLFTAMVVNEIGAYRVVRAEHWRVGSRWLDSVERAQVLSFDGPTAESLQACGTDAAKTLHYVRLVHGMLFATVAGPDETTVAEVLRAIRERYPFERPQPGPSVPFVFWAMGKHGPQSYRREIDVPTWLAIRHNYPAKSFDVLRPMMAWTEPGRGGQLVLWMGLPGTGKTWAIRALASEWREWCRFEYITDPDQLFGDASYLSTVLLEAVANEGVAEGKGAVGEDPQPPQWRCLVLEDTGELLAADAKTQQGQALSRLLNTVDGLLGQGLRILLLITTNEELKALHPAVTRPGRCLYRVPFVRFEQDEAQRWLTAHAGVDGWKGQGATLAELYHAADQFPLVKPEGARVGFR